MILVNEKLIEQFFTDFLWNYSLIRKCNSQAVKKELYNLIYIIYAK